MRLRARSGAAAPPPSAPRRGASTPALVVLVALFVCLAALVEAGALSALDQYSLDHLMPALSPPVPHTGGLATGLYRPFGSGTVWWEMIPDLWCYPCSVLVSALVVASLLGLTRRRGGALRANALALAGAWVAGNALELAGKGLIARPALYLTTHGERVHISGFDASFPSGHMIRGAVVLAALTLVVPRARRLLRLWYALVAPALVVSSAHTPSDVVGGLLLGLALVGAAAGLASSPQLLAPARQLRARRLRRAGAS